MALSRFEYVKSFERDEPLLPNCWLVVRIDGRSFHRFSDVHEFRKPNDDSALDVMTAAAEAVLAEFDDCVLAYGASDEYSFVLRPSTTLFGRRGHKLTTTIVSTFTAAYVYHWPRLMGPDCSLRHLPSFDGRIVAYPSDANLRDYLSWRQADCHVNNLFNTAYWTLVREGGESRVEAKKIATGLDAAGKNELLFSRFGINYARQPARHRKGTTLIRVWDTAGEHDEADVAESEAETSAAAAAAEGEVETKAKAKANGEAQVEAAAEQGRTTAVTLREAETTLVSDAGHGATDAAPPNRSGRGDERSPRRPRRRIAALHEDLIGDAFWEAHPGIVPYDEEASAVASSSRGAARRAQRKAAKKEKKKAYRAAQRKAEQQAQSETSK